MANTEILSKILSNDLCAKWINLRDYAFDKLSSNADIKAIMDVSTKYGYGEWVCEGQVPVMTSVTAPYGELSCSNSAYLTDTNLVSLFNRTKYLSDTVSIDINSAGGTFSIQYKFMEPTIVKAFGYAGSGTSTADAYYKAFTADIQISNDGTNWTTVHEHSWTVEEHKATFRKLSCYKFDNDQSALYVRIKFNGANYTYGNNLKLGALQFYAYQPKGNVPIMTSNTAPYGEAFSGYSGSDQWKIFDEDISTFHNTTGSTMYAGYKFVNPIKVKKARTHFKSDQFSWVTGYKLQASNDGSTWVDLTEDVISSLSAGFNDVYVTKNEGYYLYYREWWTCTSGPHREYLQFYGREMKVSIPTMTSNTQPWGEAIDSSSYSSYEPYRVFDKVANTYWNSQGLDANTHLGFKFEKAVCIKFIDYHNAPYSQDTRLHLYAFDFKGSNDGINWETLESYTITDPNTINKEEAFIVDHNDSYKYYALFRTSGGAINQVQVGELNFFGFDYSERDWDTEHPMKYLYDHGVELEEMGSSGNVSKLSDKTVVDGTSAIGWFGTKNKIDITSYNLLRLLTGLIYKIGSYTPSLQVSSSSGGGAIATATLKPPHDSSLDISNVNNEQALFVGQTTYTGWQFDVEEFWLE